MFNLKGGIKMNYTIDLSQDTKDFIKEIIKSYVTTTKAMSDDDFTSYLNAVDKTRVRISPGMLRMHNEAVKALNEKEAIRQRSQEK